MDRRASRLRRAVHSGRVAADSRVARGLYARAIGYERNVKRTVIVPASPRSYQHDPLSARTCRPASSGCATAAVRRGAMHRTTGHPTPSTTSPCSRPPARACAIMTVIEAPPPRLSQTIGRCPLRSPGLTCSTPSPGAARHGARRRERSRAVAVRGAAEARPRPAGARQDARRGRAAAVASGHGVGKSALVAWIILWALSTLPDTRGVVTANTEGQLRTKTWPELAKWHGLAINRDWFTYTATALHSVAARPRAHLARRCHHLVGEQHRGHRRPAQQGPPRLRPVRRGLVDRRRRVGDHRGRADRRRHRAVLAASSAIPRAPPAASANASPAAASPIAGSRSRSIRARCR